MKANLVQRIISSAGLMLGDYGFKPYEELVVSDDEEELMQYKNECDRLANNLSKKFEMIKSVGDSAKIISKPLESSANGTEIECEGKHLLRFLADVERLNQFDPKSVKELESFQDLEEDILLRTIENKWLIDTQAMTVFDNKRTTEVKTLEMSDSYTSVEPLLDECYDPHDYNIKLNYILLKRLALIREDDTKATEWLAKESTIPSELKEFEFIIYKNDTNSDIRLAELCQSVWDKLKINGFFQVFIRDKQIGF